MPPRSPAGSPFVRVFVSSAEGNADDELLTSLLRELQQTREGVRVRASSRLDVQPGDVMSERRLELLEEAQFIVLLVTPAYLVPAPQLYDESFKAMEKSRDHTAIVIPVLFTEADLPHTPFGNLVPLRPNHWQHPKLFSAEIAQEIHKVIVQRVRSRLTGARDETAGFQSRISYGSHFRSSWRLLAGLLVLATTGTLIWFSASPADHHIRHLSPSPFTFFFNSLVIGVAAMSLIQIFRRLFRVRGAFHRNLTEEWLGIEASEELYREVGTQRIDDMFDLSSALLTGQLGAIADRIMEKQGKNEPTSRLIQRMAAEDGVFRAPATGEQDPRIRYAMAIQRNLDQFQISTSAQWGRYLLRTSILLSMGLFILGLPLLDTGGFIPGLVDIPPAARRLTASAQTGNFVFLLMATVLTALLAGFLGSIARDVVAIMEKLRR
jgi:hypothetical protein